MVVWYHTIPTIPLFAKIIVAMMGGLVAVRAYAHNIFEDDVILVKTTLQDCLGGNQQCEDVQALLVDLRYLPYHTYHNILPPKACHFTP